VLAFDFLLHPTNKGSFAKESYKKRAFLQKAPSSGSILVLAANTLQKEGSFGEESYKKRAFFRIFAKEP